MASITGLHYNSKVKLFHILTTKCGTINRRRIVPLRQFAKTRITFEEPLFDVSHEWCSDPDNKCGGNSDYVQIEHDEDRHNCDGLKIEDKRICGSYVDTAVETDFGMVETTALSVINIRFHSDREGHHGKGFRAKICGLDEHDCN